MAAKAKERVVIAEGATVLHRALGPVDEQAGYEPVEPVFLTNVDPPIPLDSLAVYQQKAILAGQVPGVRVEEREPVAATIDNGEESE